MLPFLHSTLRIDWLLMSSNRTNTQTGWNQTEQKGPWYIKKLKHGRYFKVTSHPNTAHFLADLD